MHNKHRLSIHIHNCIVSAPIGALKCNFPPFCTDRLINRERLANRTTNRRTWVVIWKHCFNWGTLFRGHKKKHFFLTDNQEHCSQGTKKNPWPTCHSRTLFQGYNKIPLPTACHLISTSTYMAFSPVCKSVAIFLESAKREDRGERRKRKLQSNLVMF